MSKEEIALTVAIVALAVSMITFFWSWILDRETRRRRKGDLELTDRTKFLEVWDATPPPYPVRFFGMDLDAIVALQKWYYTFGGTLPVTPERIDQLFEGVEERIPPPS